MNRTFKEFVVFLGQWLLGKVVVLLPALYLVCRIATGSKVDFFYLALLFLIGCLISAIYSDWNKQGLAFEKVEYGTDEGLRGLWRSMTFWEKWHWIPVLGFLGLTFWATLQGLDLLFVGPKNPFLWLFTAFVVIVLIFLLVMISRGKNVVAYSIFYILFDLATAFSFNFIHFYDNISATQNMDRDVRACEMYIKHQKPTLSRIHESAVADTVVLYSKISGTDLDIKSYYEVSTELKLRAENSVNDIEANQLKRRANEQERKARNRERIIDKDRTRLISLRSVCASASLMKETQLKIEDLTALYQENKETFTIGKLTELKNNVVSIDEQVAHFNRDTFCISHGYVFDSSNDTIEWALARLKKTRDDRFASINKLLDLVFKSNKPNASKEIEERNPFVADDKQFDNRLIILSICLSATIDILPLLLSIFVVYSKKRKKTI